MDFLNVGKIINTHGIKGEVKVHRITDFEERFEIGTTLWIKQTHANPLVKVVIDGHRIHKNFDLLHFENMDNINDVEQFKDCFLVIEKDNLIPLETNEYYYHEIIGCTVMTTDHSNVGDVTEILSPGANDVWVVKDNKNKEVLIPYIEQVVKEIRVEEKKIVIEPMEGLLD